MTDAPTAPIPVQAPPRRRRRRWPWVLIGVLLVLAVVGVVGAFVGDRIFREQAQQQIEQQVTANLPEGVTGRVTATIEGDWVLPQYLAGSFDHVTLTTRSLRVAGAPASARIQLYGLPVAGGPVAQTTANLTVGQAAFRDLPALKAASASAPTLGPDSLTTTVSRTFLGIGLKVKVTMEPTLVDQLVELRTKDATLIAGPVSVPAKAIVDQLLPNGVNVCAAEYLPRGVSLTYMKVKKGAVTVGLSAFQVDPQKLDATKTGSCG